MAPVKIIYQHAGERKARHPKSASPVTAAAPHIPPRLQPGCCRESEHKEEKHWKR
jgi:hypothetical protein